mgnify:CR=1 FL=1
MSLGEGIEAFDSLKKLDEYLSIYALKQKKSKHSPTLIEDVAKVQVHKWVHSSYKTRK